MHRRTPASTLTSAVTLSPSRSGQRLTFQRHKFRRTAVRRSSPCSTVTSVTVEEDRSSAAERPWTTFENHIKAINVNEFQLEAKRIGRPPSADFQKVLHDFQVTEMSAETKHDLDTSLREDLDVRPTAISSDL